MGSRDASSVDASSSDGPIAGDASPFDGTVRADAGVADGGSADTNIADASRVDAFDDAGSDARVSDASRVDAASAADAAPEDAAIFDAIEVDAAVVDARSVDGASGDAAAADTGATDAQPYDSAYPPPQVTAGGLRQLECTGWSSRTVTQADLSPPVVSSPVDPAPMLVARLGAPNGPLMSFPRSFDLGTTVVWWVATDRFGGVGYDSQVVRVRDTAPPALTGGAAVTLEATAFTGTPFSPTPASATDTCMDPVAPAVTHDAPALLALGVTVVTFTAEDDEGNQSAATRNYAVEDTTPPVFDPALSTLTVAHDGSQCFVFAPPNPGVRDDGYPLSSLTISGERVAGPGVPGTCWDIGTHTYRWTARDPSGNSVVADQTITVGVATLVVQIREVRSLFASLGAGAYADRAVDVVVEVSGGTAPYSAGFTPGADSVTWLGGGQFAGRFSTPGAYAGVVASASDGAAGAGSAIVPAFGIDTTPPRLLTPPELDQSDVVLGSTVTYPRWYAGESIPMRDFGGEDGASTLRSGRAMVFDGASLVTVSGRGSLAAPDALTIEGWLRRRGADGTMLQHGLHAALGVSAGRPYLEVRPAGVVARVTGAAIAPDRWVHVAGTYDGARVRLYVDGRPAAYRAATGTIASAGTSVEVGDGLDGDLAEVAYWHAALDEADIRGHHAGGRGRPWANVGDLILQLRFTGDQQTVVDLSGLWHDGVLGASSMIESSDPARIDLMDPTDDTASGLVELTLDIEHASSAQLAALLTQQAAPSGSPLTRGLRAIADLGCVGPPTTPVCDVGAHALSALAIASWRGTGAYTLSLLARDHAGNSSASQLGLRVATLASPWFAEIDAHLAALIQSGAGLNDLEDARQYLGGASDYLTQWPEYRDGAYLLLSLAALAVGDAGAWKRADQACNLDDAPVPPKSRNEYAVSQRSRELWVSTIEYEEEKAATLPGS